MNMIKRSALWGAGLFGVVAFGWFCKAAIRAGYGHGIEAGPVGESLLIVMTIFTGLAALVGAGAGAIAGLMRRPFMRPDEVAPPRASEDEGVWPPPPKNPAA